MRLHKWKHDKVHPDGTVTGGGAVGVQKGVTLSDNEGGCGMGTCRCSEGHWICISEGRDANTSTVYGTTINFDNKKEMLDFIANTDFEKVRSIGLSEQSIDTLRTYLPIALEVQREEENLEEDD